MPVLVAQLISEVGETSRNLSSAFRHMSLQDQLSTFPSVESADILRCISTKKTRGHLDGLQATLGCEIILKAKKRRIKERQLLK